MLPLSKRNRRGLLLLVILCLLISLTPRVLLLIFPGEDFKLSMLEVKSAKEELKNQEKGFVQKKRSIKRKRFRIPKSKFDPNNYKLNDWMQLGLSEKQSSIIIKFTERGINSDAELKKIFVIPEELFELIKDSTVYPTTLDNPIKKELEIQELEINRASKVELMKLPGIGDYFADKIVQYRESLGGYISSEQLLEIWKFDQSKLTQISSRIKIDPALIRKFGLNSVSIDELKSHPYITYKVANSIVKYRESHQRYTSVSEIKNSVLVDEELFAKISPYLKID